MMQIGCPWCGIRDEREFVCGGTTHISRPPLESDDRAWGEYLFFRDNPKGMHLERWRHAYGCGMWFNVARDTVTHRIAAVYRMTDPPPVL
jgi:sarcosine oxidase, subunit delta